MNWSWGHLWFPVYDFSGIDFSPTALKRALHGLPLHDWLPALELFNHQVAPRANHGLVQGIQTTYPYIGDTKHSCHMPRG